MKVAIDISPLENTQHQVRGVGSYLANLKEHLEKTKTDLSLCYFTDTSRPDSDTDLIHYPYFDPFHCVINLREHIKTVVTVHDLTPIVLKNLFPVGLRGNIAWYKNRYLLRKTDGIITDSDSSARDVERLAGVERDRLSVVYLAAGEQYQPIHNAKSEREVRNKYTLPERFLLYVGDVTPNKNLPRVIEAVKSLQIPLVLVGKVLADREYDVKHPWNRDLAHVQREISGDRNFIALGFVDRDELVALYNMATVFVMPSLYEGFGLPILEAMVCGTPVVTSSQGSLGEIAGDAAVFVDPYNTKDIAKGIKILWDDEGVRKEYSVKGLSQAKKFSWQKTADETVSFYEKVLNR